MEMDGGAYVRPVERLTPARKAETTQQSVEVPRERSKRRYLGLRRRRSELIGRATRLSVRGRACWT